MTAVAAPVTATDGAHGSGGGTTWTSIMESTQITTVVVHDRRGGVLQPSNDARAALEPRMRLYLRALVARVASAT